MLAWWRPIDGRSLISGRPKNSTNIDRIATADHVLETYAGVQYVRAVSKNPSNIVSSPFSAELVFDLCCGVR